MKGILHVFYVMVLVGVVAGCKVDASAGDRSEAAAGHAAATLSAFISAPIEQPATNTTPETAAQTVSVSADLQAVVDCPDGVCKPKKTDVEPSPDPQPKPELRKPVRKFLKWLIRG